MIEDFHKALAELTSPVWLSIEHYPNDLRYVMFVDGKGNLVTATYTGKAVIEFNKRTAILHVRHG